MKNILVIFIFTFFVNSHLLNAQDPEKSFMNLQEFEKNKQEFIIKEAQLTTKEAEVFFPLNIELQKKKLELHRKYHEDMKQAKDAGNISEEEYKKLINSNIDIRMKEAELDKEYSEKFNKIISPQKLFRIQQAEKIYMQEELRKYREAKKQGRIRTGQKHR